MRVYTYDIILYTYMYKLTTPKGIYVAQQRVGVDFVPGDGRVSVSPPARAVAPFSPARV